MQSILESRLLFFRRYRSDAAQVLFLQNEAHLIDILDRTLITNAITRFMTVPAWSDPVLVTPTTEQMNAAFGDPVPRPEGACSICQEQFGSDSLVRLRNCQHTFHRGCANTWYTRSVYCPLCRNDIRS
jgi:hypothetical protein